ncbi:MAG: PAS-domain containing protein [Microcoleus sp. PH2017_17_BER_D_A]|nr:PAS-domain containing protein [Microcoleus sp. PH2017_17_BER_D_A]
MSKLYQGKSQSNTGILVVDNNRRIVSINRNFIELWSLPKYVIDSQNEFQALQLASHYLEEPQKFVKQITEVYQLLNLNAVGC